jgi:hypothetical protein
MAAELTPTDLAIFGSGGGSIDLEGIRGRSERGSPPRERRRTQGEGITLPPPDLMQIGADPGKQIYSQLHYPTFLTVSLLQQWLFRLLCRTNSQHNFNTRH